MERKKVMIVLFFAALVVAGYFYYPVMEEGPAGKGSLGEGGRILPVGPATITAAGTGGELKGDRAAQDYATIAGIYGTGRQISVTVTISLEVTDVKEVANRVMSLSYSLGGYVQHSRVAEERGYITIKVPKSNLDAALRQIRSWGEVKLEEVDTVDLTDAIIDLEARLRNAKAEEQRLLQLLEKAESIRDILEIEDRLSAVRERIERLEAMKEGMEKRVDFATINVNLWKKGYQPGKESFLDRIIQDAGRALLGSIYLIVVGAAFLLIPAVIALAVWLAYRRAARGNSETSM